MQYTRQGRTAKDLAATKISQGWFAYTEGSSAVWSITKEDPCSFWNYNCSVSCWSFSRLNYTLFFGASQNAYRVSGLRLHAFIFRNSRWPSRFPFRIKLWYSFSHRVQWIGIPSPPFRKNAKPSLGNGHSIPLNQMRYQFLEMVTDLKTSETCPKSWAGMRISANSDNPELMFLDLLLFSG